MRWFPLPLASSRAPVFKQKVERVLGGKSREQLDYYGFWPEQASREVRSIIRCKMGICSLNGE